MAIWPTGSWFPPSSEIPVWAWDASEWSGPGFSLILTLCLVEVATSYNTEFQKDTLEGLQNPFSNSGDIKMAKKALELTFSDFNH